MSEINVGTFDNTETVKSLRFATFALKKLSTAKYSPYETISKLNFTICLRFG
jgi:hypothetical protein